MSNIEKIAFTEDLNRHQDKETFLDDRAEWIEARVEELMKGEYSPSLPNNVTEALSELCFADQSMLAAYIQMCMLYNSDYYNRINLADFVIDRVDDYWHSTAVKIAADEYEKSKV